MMTAPHYYPQLSSLTCAGANKKVKQLFHPSLLEKRGQKSSKFLEKEGDHQQQPCLHRNIPGQLFLITTWIYSSYKPGGFQPAGLISMRMTAPFRWSQYCHYLLRDGRSRNSASSSSCRIDKILSATINKPLSFCSAFHQRTSMCLNELVSTVPQSHSNST